MATCSNAPTLAPTGDRRGTVTDPVDTGITVLPITDAVHLPARIAAL